MERIKMEIQIMSLVIAGLIVFYFLRKEQVKHDDYFGKKRKFTKNEQTILDHYKIIYKPIPHDKRLPNIERDGFELEDISLTATKVVYKNPIPTPEEIGKVKSGDFVKLLFIDKDGEVERMWVEVLEYNDNIFKGLLKDDALVLEDLTDSKTIYFHSNNIYDIEI